MSPGTCGEALDSNSLSESVYSRRKTQNNIERKGLGKKGRETGKRNMREVKTLIS